MPRDDDPFEAGPHDVAVRTVEAVDTARDRRFPCEVWAPADVASPAPLVVFSHSSGGGRRQSTFLCSHLASHGYVVVAADHSEVVAPELAPQPDETDARRTARLEAMIASRVPDVQFVIDHALTCGLPVDADRIGIVGHSFGGWTALAAPDDEPRLRAVVALAPAGASNPKRGMLDVSLGFAWGRDVPTLYLVAEDDASMPLAGMYELVDRSPAPARMVVLRRADHMHFMDDVERMHEVVRNMEFPEALSWLPKAMRPITELCSGDVAHTFARGLTVAHLDAVLRGKPSAQRFLDGDVAAALARRGVDAFVREPA